MKVKLFKNGKANVKIEYWDLWSLDHSLAKIILPLLREYVKYTADPEKVSGSCMVQDEDAPSHITDVHERWDWVVGEMVFAFENTLDDSIEQSFYPDNLDLVLYEPDDGGNRYLSVVGADDIDREGLGAHRARVQNGFRLFGTYFQGLWT